MPIVNPRKATGVFSKSATRQYTPGGVGQMQTIHDTRYATKTFSSGAIAGTTAFFQAAPSADPTLDRYTGNNNLVDSGQTWEIHSIGVMVKDSTSATFADMVSFIQLCALRLWISSKEYGVFPLIDLPAGGGPFIQGGNISLSQIASPGTVSPYGILNGNPQRRKMRLHQPLEIQGNQSIYAEIMAPVTTAITLTGALIVRVEFEGLWTRPAA